MYTRLCAEPLHSTGSRNQAAFDVRDQRKLPVALRLELGFVIRVWGAQGDLPLRANPWLLRAVLVPRPSPQQNPPPGLPARSVPGILENWVELATGSKSCCLRTPRDAQERGSVSQVSLHSRSLPGLSEQFAVPRRAGGVSPAVHGVAGHLSQHRARLQCCLLLAQWWGQQQGILPFASGLPCP